MSCDLESMFGGLAAELPTSFEGNEDIILSSQNLPVPPPRLVSDRLYIEKRARSYEYTYQVDRLNFYAHKPTYTHLGLLLLAVVFHPEPPEVIIELTHPASEVKSLIFEYEYRSLEHLPSGYHTRPYGLVYYPSETHKHPFDKDIPPVGLPCFGLTNMKDCVITEDDYRGRDTVRGFGSDVGNVLFAELLLNAGQPENLTDEYELEGEGGFRGVGVTSAEVTLFLPGHVFWDTTKWEGE
jgi:hypothetical protein